MPTNFEKYRFTKRTVLSDETFNRIWQDIDLRIAALEDIKKDWKGAVDELTRYGLLRINEALVPSFQYIEQKKDEADNIVSEISELRENADSMINEKRDDAIQSVNEAKTDALNAIEQRRQQFLSEFNINTFYAFSFLFGGE